MGLLSRLFKRGGSAVNTANEYAQMFGVNAVTSEKMEKRLRKWRNIAKGQPDWIDTEDGIFTVNMAQHICDTRAKLVMLDIGIKADNEYVQSLCDSLLKKVYERISDAEKFGGMIIKFNGETWETIMPDDFTITDVSGNREITGAIFSEHVQTTIGNFTRLEYHSFENGEYVIRNKAFKDKVQTNDGRVLGAEVPLGIIPDWANIEPEMRLENVVHPLFAFFRLNNGNSVDPNSPLGMSAFANAIAELRMLDIAVSRKNSEVEDSKHITFVGQGVIQAANDPKRRNRIKLPRFVKGLGIGVDDDTASSVKEHVPTLLTDARIKDINFDLSMIGIKCGFSEGVFVLDGQSGMITATQVEADDRDTVQTIKADRDALKTAIERAIEAAVIISDIQGIESVENYELNFNFGDITYNYSEDKTAWQSYVMQGWIPAWKYLVKFEGMSEEEAKALVEEANKDKESFDESQYE